MTKINLDEKFRLFSEQWRPKIIAAANGQEVKLVKAEGQFPWHHHDDEDEFFLVEFRSRTHRGGGYDADVASTGVVIWQVKQDAKKGLAQVPSSRDRGVKVAALLSRGAPGWEEGGTRAWTDANGPVGLKWIDGTDTGTRLRVGPVSADGGNVTVSWDRS